MNIIPYMCVTIRFNVLRATLIDTPRVILTSRLTRAHTYKHSFVYYLYVITQSIQVPVRSVIA